MSCDNLFKIFYQTEVGFFEVQSIKARAGTGKVLQYPCHFVRLLGKRYLRNSRYLGTYKVQITLHLHGQRQLLL